MTRNRVAARGGSATGVTSGLPQGAQRVIHVSYRMCLGHPRSRSSAVISSVRYPMHTCMYTRTCMPTYIYIHIFTHLSVCTHIQYVYTYMYIYIYIYGYVCVRSTSQLSYVMVSRRLHIVEKTWRPLQSESKARSQTPRPTLQPQRDPAKRATEKSCAPRHRRHGCWAVIFET